MIFVAWRTTASSRGFTATAVQILFGHFFHKSLLLGIASVLLRALLWQVGLFSTKGHVMSCYLFPLFVLLTIGFYEAAKAVEPADGGTPKKAAPAEAPKRARNPRPTGKRKKKRR